MFNIHKTIQTARFYYAKHKGNRIICTADQRISVYIPSQSKFIKSGIMI